MFLQQFVGIEINDFFFGAPIFIQIIFIVFIIAIVILSLILTYYILKGVFLLLKGIFKGTFKVSKEIVKGVVSGTKKEEKSTSQQAVISPQVSVQGNSPRYCSGCGAGITESMLQQLARNNIAYCSLCGAEFKMD